MFQKKEQKKTLKISESKLKTKYGSCTHISTPLWAQLNMKGEKVSASVSFFTLILVCTYLSKRQSIILLLQ